MMKKHTWESSQNVSEWDKREETIKRFKINLLTQCLCAPRMTKLLPTQVCNNLSQLLCADGIDGRLATSEVGEIRHLLYAAGFSSEDNGLTFIK